MKEIIAAAIGAIVSLALSAVMTLKENARFFSNTVSGERMNWIKDIRKLAAELFTVCEQYDPNTLPEEQCTVFLNARNGILIRLNPDGSGYSLDSRLHQLLDDPDFATVKGNLPEIRSLLGKILKSEWDKVKVEAGNSRSKVRQIEKIQAQIEMEKNGN